MKINHKSNLERAGVDSFADLSCFGRRSKKHVLLISFYWPKILKIGPKSAPEAPNWHMRFAEGAAPGGMGPWSGHAREVKLYSSSKSQETRIMKPKTKHDHENNKKHDSEKQRWSNTPVSQWPGELVRGVIYLSMHHLLVHWSMYCFKSLFIIHELRHSFIEPFSFIHSRIYSFIPS